MSSVPMHDNIIILLFQLFLVFAHHILNSNTVFLLTVMITKSNKRNCNIIIMIDCCILYYIEHGSMLYLLY